ncbi:FkbM family methyltransferase [Paraglaciecola aquimarina]|uniref:FkbM family methyltransferase n=1 Tax=Paraglaciecola algarum TaxID=3050085 RepID=A0ABS9D6V2_9ALTE|nr:FkbM family methyltransferase [Paraglaciecola sp. G1-23]MCF2947768.1 FkbM family methyltransferase [Paraglaciecola sp. G1-23]
MQKFDWPGKHRFYLWLCKNHPNRLIAHRINKQTFWVPIDEWCFWLEKGPDNYYLNEFLPFFDAINKVNKPITFFDLGADIGTVSALANKYCKNVSLFCAFEPNPKSFKLLNENLSNISANTICQNMAVSDINGQVFFNASENRSIDHEGCIDKSKSGSTKVVTLDTWIAENNITATEYLALKIDVEGQEQQTILGAKKLIKQAKTLAILLEIHPEVLAATTTTPEQLFETLETIRNVKWLVPALGNCQINRSVDFFKQFPKKQYDVIAILD